MTAMWNKAVVAGRSAEWLLQAGDSNGAINRAYYAMFCAARAALRHVDPALDQSKSHVGVIRAFGHAIIQGKGVDPDLGRIIGRLEQIRISADYDEDVIPLETARVIVADMQRFLSTISDFVGQNSP